MRLQTPAWVPNRRPVGSEPTVWTVSEHPGPVSEPVSPVRTTSFPGSKPWGTMGGTVGGGGEEGAPPLRWDPETIPGYPVPSCAPGGTPSRIRSRTGSSSLSKDGLQQAQYPEVEITQE